MRKKILKTLGWIALVAIVLFFNKNMPIMAAVVLGLVITEWGPGIFLKVGKKAGRLLMDKITSEFKPKNNKGPSAGSGRGKK